MKPVASPSNWEKNSANGADHWGKTFNDLRQRWSEMMRPAGENATSLPSDVELQMQLLEQKLLRQHQQSMGNLSAPTGSGRWILPPFAFINSSSCSDFLGNEVVAEQRYYPFRAKPCYSVSDSFLRGVHIGV